MPAPTTVGDLSIEEFKQLVHQIVLDTLRELIADPDEGLPLREDFAAALQQTLHAVKEEQATLYTAEDVAKETGLEW